MSAGLLNIFSVQVEEGWWSGNLNGKSGLFPSNFVKELDATGEDGESNDTVADETGKTEAANRQGLISVKGATYLEKHERMCTGILCLARHSINTHLKAGAFAAVGAAFPVLTLQRSVNLCRVLLICTSCSGTLLSASQQLFTSFFREQR